MIKDKNVFKINVLRIFLKNSENTTDDIKSYAVNDLNSSTLIKISSNVSNISHQRIYYLYSKPNILYNYNTSSNCWFCWILR